VAAPSQWQLGAIRSRRRRPVAIARPVYRATVGWTLATSGNSAGGEVLARYRLQRIHCTHHPCLGLDRDQSYSAVGGEQSMNRQHSMNSSSRFPCWTTWKHTIGGRFGDSAAVDGWGCA